MFCFFFFNDTATTEIYTLSLHDALPIWRRRSRRSRHRRKRSPLRAHEQLRSASTRRSRSPSRSEEHKSELQSRQYIVCRLLLEKKKKITGKRTTTTTQHKHIQYQVVRHT